MRKMIKFTKLFACVTGMIIILGICGVYMFSKQVQAAEDSEIQLL